MNCDQISSSLPWYLNGSLPAEEQARIGEHLESCEDCRRQLQETSWLVRAIAEHASHRELIDLVRENPLRDRMAIERHLEVCPRCSDSKKLIELMDSIAPAAAPLTAGAPSSIAPSSIAPSSTIPSSTSSSSRSLRNWAVAASLAAIVATGAWIHEEIRPMTPQPTQIVELDPPIVRRSSGSAAATTKVVEVSAEQPQTTFLYPLPGAEKLRPFTRFSGELSAGGEVLWRDEDWRANERQGFAVNLPTSILHPEAEHRLELRGWTGDNWQVIDTVSFSVRERDRP